MCPSPLLWKQMNVFTGLDSQCGAKGAGTGSVLKESHLCVGAGAGAGE